LSPPYYFLWCPCLFWGENHAGGKPCHVSTTTITININTIITPTGTLPTNLPATAEERNRPGKDFISPGVHAY
jgi:hypothetical protein